MPKINFLIPSDHEYGGGEEIENINLEDHAFFINSQRAWLVQTYLHLKNLSDSIVFSNNLLPDAINVLHCDEMLKYSDAKEYFTVSVVADRRVYLGGNLIIVQNSDQITTSKDHWVIHWPQKNIIPRVSSGKESTFRVGFLGLEKNSIDLKNIIKYSKYADKIEVVVRGPGEWHDYSDLDVVVAIRDFVSKNSQKPPTKLINAWRAGVVFIGGIDSAYEQVGVPGYDYIKCASPGELINQIDKLVEQPKLKREMVAAGARSATNFTDARIVQQWLDFFETVGVHEFEQWKEKSDFSRIAFRWYRFLIYTVLRTKRYLLAKVGKY